MCVKREGGRDREREQHKIMKDTAVDDRCVSLDQSLFLLPGHMVPGQVII